MDSSPKAALLYCSTFMGESSEETFPASSTQNSASEVCKQAWCILKKVRNVCCNEQSYVWRKKGCRTSWEWIQWDNNKFSIKHHVVCKTAEDEKEAQEEQAEGSAVALTAPPRHQTSVDRPLKSSACKTSREPHRTGRMTEITQTRTERLSDGCKKPLQAVILDKRGVNKDMAVWESVILAAHRNRRFCHCIKKTKR